MPEDLPHPADLAVSALRDRYFQEGALWPGRAVVPGGQDRAARALREHPIEHHPGLELPHRFGGGAALETHPVHLLDPAPAVGHAGGELAVVREEEEARAVG